MTEFSQFKKAIIKLICVGLCGILYTLGGLEGGGGLWIRRFLMPVFFTGTLFYFSRNWKSLITLPLFIGTLTLGYGGTENVSLKIIRRLIFGLANGATSSTFNITKKEYLLSAIQIVGMAALYIAFGVFNPVNSATEQLVLGSALVFIPIMTA